MEGRRTMLGAWEQDGAHDGEDMNGRDEIAFVGVWMDLTTSWELGWRGCFFRVAGLPLDVAQTS